MIQHAGVAIGDTITEETAKRVQESVGSIDELPRGVPQGAKRRRDDDADAIDVGAAWPGWAAQLRGFRGRGFEVRGFAARLVEQPTFALRWACPRIDVRSLACHPWLAAGERRVAVREGFEPSVGL